MVGFDNGSESERILDGRTVAEINSNLTSGVDTSQAIRLANTAGLVFMGDTKGGPFDVDLAVVSEMLGAANPHGRPNSDVVTPWVNGRDLTRRPRHMFIIDFGAEMKEEEASRYEMPFEFVRRYVKPARDRNKRSTYRRLWWLHVEARPAMRQALRAEQRFISTPRVTKHRLFVRLDTPTLPDSQVFAFARSDDYFFGVLHSRLHELWALRLGTRLETRPRYTPTTCFETFAFPWPPGQEPEGDPRVVAIAEAARELNKLRETWLNPPEWTKEEVLEFPGSLDGPWKRYLHDPDERGIGTVRYPRIVPRGDEYAAKLKKRTLTHLYNERPTWLDLAHRKLDEAVFTAYGWEPGMNDEELLGKLLALNRKRADKVPITSQP